MSVRTDITTTGNPEAAIKRFADRYGVKRMRSVVGPRLTRMVQRNYLSLGTNQRGFPSTHFWARAAKSTTWYDLPDGVLIRTDMIGPKQRLYGGPIRTVNKKSLAYPIDADSYGKVPSDFGDELFPIRAKGNANQSGAGFLARRIGTGKNARIQVLFKLSKGVNQQPNDKVIPSRQAMLKEAKDAIVERN